MATYIIGDVQGCYAELMQLLEKINFNPASDRLGFVGDLVNRGPDSLSTLRFIKNLRQPLVVLGNHDLYLLALGYGVVNYEGPHTLHAVFQAPDKLELLEWLRAQPLAIYLKETDTILVHAGVPPQWNLSQLLSYADEVSIGLRGQDYLRCLRNLRFHHNEPPQWHEQLSAADRVHYIADALTRMRFCTADGTLDMNNKTATTTDPNLFRPWYEWYRLPHRVLFGHWAALEGREINPRCEALDTGCCWGRELTAFCVESGQRFSVPAAKGE